MEGEGVNNNPVETEMVELKTRTSSETNDYDDISTKVDSDNRSEGSVERRQPKFIVVKTQAGKTYRFEVIRNAADGCCMYRAICQALYSSETYHSQVREALVDFITDKSNWGKYLEHIMAQHDHLAECCNEAYNQELFRVEETSQAAAATSRNPRRVKSKTFRADINNNTSRDDSALLKHERQQSNIKMKAGFQARLVSWIWRNMYVEYMRTGSSYGTMQEIIAAGQYYEFNLVVIREVNEDLFNILNFTEQNWDKTFYFYFSGDSDDGHFELLLPASMSRTSSGVVARNSEVKVTPAEIRVIPNGDYMQTEWDDEIATVVIEEIVKLNSSRNETSQPMRDDTLSGAVVASVPESISKNEANVTKDKKSEASDSTDYPETTDSEQESGHITKQKYSRPELITNAKAHQTDIYPGRKRRFRTHSEVLPKSPKPFNSRPSISLIYSETDEASEEQTQSIASARSESTEYSDIPLSDPQRRGIRSGRISPVGVGKYQTLDSLKSPMKAVKRVLGFIRKCVLCLLCPCLYIKKYRS